MAKRDFVAEILQRRGRSKHSFAVGNLFRRMLRLEIAFDQSGTIDPEMMRYFPIAIVACMESFFRATISELIDAGEPYTNRLDEFENMKVEPSVIRAIHGQRITAGEFVSHLVPINSLEDIDRSISVLVNDDFIKRVKTVRDRWAIEVEGQLDAPIIVDPGKIIAGVKEAFRIRHILAHEFSNDETLFDRTMIEESFRCSTTFLRAASAVINEIRFPGSPLTQLAMNEKSADDFATADAALNDAVSALNELLESEEQKLLATGQSAWEITRNTTATIGANLQGKGGTIWPVLYYSLARSLTATRMEEIRHVIGIHESMRQN